MENKNGHLLIIHLKKIFNRWIKRIGYKWGENGIYNQKLIRW